MTANIGKLANKLAIEIDKMEEYWRLPGFMEKADEISDMVLHYFDMYPELMTYQFKSGSILGMIACWNGLKRIVARVLADPVASLIQTRDTKTSLGMFCADYGYEDLARLAWQNPEARYLQDKEGVTLSMHIVANRLRMLDTARLVLQDRDACSIKDNAGYDTYDWAGELEELIDYIPSDVKAQWSNSI